jgi:hypothetical protein
MNPSRVEEQPVRARRTWPLALALPVVLLVEGVLGLAGWLPVWQVQMLATGIARHYGRYSTKDYFQDGAIVVWLATAIVWLVYVPLAVFVTRALLRRWPGERRLGLALCLALLLLPSIWLLARTGLLLP